MSSASPSEPSGVLVVDDDPTIVSLLGSVLTQGGYDVRVATGGARALELARSRAPELVLLDLTMPDLDGLEVCRRLKSDPATVDTPVIVISAVDDVDEKVRAFEVGAADYVMKPFEPREVLARVGAHVLLHRLRRELERQNLELQRKNDELEQAERRTRHVFSALASALPGTVLDGRYRLDEKIGAGGYGTVFRGEQIELQRPVAVKVFRPWEGNDTPAALARFRREGVAACRVQHPNAVSVLDCGISPGGIAYIVMELLRGVSLQDLLKERGPLPLARTVEIVAPVCEALAAAHAAGLAHRDIKPDNVFLHRNPQGETVKVLDFGIAKLMEREDEGQEPQTLATRGMVGTPAFMAPERIMGIDYDGRVDVYSVGVMLFLMLSGRLPFTARHGEDLYSNLMRQVSEPVPPLGVPGVPAEVEEVVQRALAKDAESRFSAAGLAEALRALVP
jgi:CheY-like chemotaxis protein